MNTFKPLALRDANVARHTVAEAGQQEGRGGQRQWQRLAKISAGQSAGCTTKSQINYACSVPTKATTNSNNNHNFCRCFSFFCGLSTTGNRTPTRPLPLPPLSPCHCSLFWKTIKAIKKSLYKLAAFAVCIFSSHHSLPLDTVRRPMASLRLLCQRMRRCAERDSVTMCALLWRLFTEQPLGNSSSSSPLLALY